jgi:hypothetical protein
VTTTTTTTTTTSTTMSRQRRSIHPGADDTWASIAARELPEVPVEAAEKLLQSCNLHVFMRRAPAADSPRRGNPILPSDVIFLEPPLAAPAGS